MQRSDVTDVSLLRRTRAYLARDSDREAQPEQLDESWVRFYEVYSGLIRRFALRTGVPQTELDDCVQDVWAEVVVALRSFHYDASRGRFRAWLFTLVRSKATNRIRNRLRRARENGSRVVEQIRLRESQQPGPADLYARRWERETVQIVLAELRGNVSPRSFDVFFLRRFEERSVADVATSLGICANQVRARQHRMQRKFADLYRQYTGLQPDGSLNGMLNS